MTDFTIRKMTIIDAEPNKMGNRLLATFDLITCGIKVVGCVFIEKENGIVKASGPMGKTHKGADIAMHFVDAPLARSVTRKVAEAYTNFTGREVSDE